jgi:transposase
MGKLNRYGLDIAKQVFQLHGVNEHGVVKARKTLPRAKVLEYFAQLPPCLIGIEASGGAHYWARELTKLGHTVKLMAAQYVAAYRKRGKNDANDAEAICEAVERPSMRFVAIKSEEQQAVLMVHRARSLTMANRVAQVNQMRGLLGEFGLVISTGAARLRRELPGILEDAENGLPTLAREVLSGLLEQLREAEVRISAYDRQIRALAEASEPARRLMQVEAIGPQTATALVATVGDPHIFKNGRGFAAWLGITPRQYSSGGKERLGRITRQGDGYLRTLLVHGARAYLRVVHKKSDAKGNWARRLKERRHVNVVAVALAAKHARIAWAILAHGTDYRPAGAQSAAA